MAKSTGFWKDLSRRKRIALGGAGGVLVLLGGLTGICYLRTWRAVSVAESQLEKGFAALAAETLDSRRRSLIRSEKHCRLLIRAYFEARRADRLDWASQSCLEAGVEIPEGYIGMAAAREFTGRDQDALTVLFGALPKFKDSPDLYYRIAQIQRRGKRDEAAAAAYLEAARRTTGPSQVALEAMEYLSSLQRWTDALEMAKRLREAKTDNPEIKLLIARVFLKAGGEAQQLQSIVAEARELMGKKPEIKVQLENAYKDVLGGGTAEAAAAPSAPPPPPLAPAPPIPPPPPAAVPGTAGVPAVPPPPPK